MSDNDLIRRGDALAAAADLYRWSIAAGEELEAAIAALLAVAVGVRPLVWEHDGTCFRAVDPVTGQTRLAMDAERAAASDADRATRILAALDLTPAPDAAALSATEIDDSKTLDPVGYAAAIRETALREARQRVNDLVAERQADLHGARNDFNRGAVDALQEACSAILALIQKGGNGRRVYMGQIMAECDCPREAECQAAGRCIAEGSK
jgi:hypothetical protein